jgi:magnesium-transporting ATPase (P-type)
MVATETTVRRDGHKLRVHSEELVPGDVVLLQSAIVFPPTCGSSTSAISTRMNPP